MKIPLLTSFAFKTWYKVSALVLLCYLPFLFNFLWGNHDWGWVKEYTPLNSGVFEGRFSQFILPTILFSGNILPILSVAFGLIFYALAAILLCRLWQMPEKSLPTILLSLCLVTAPYTLSWLYFAFLTLSCLSWPLAIIISFLVLQNGRETLGDNFFCFQTISAFHLLLSRYSNNQYYLCFQTH